MTFWAQVPDWVLLTATIKFWVVYIGDTKPQVQRCLRDSLSQRAEVMSEIELRWEGKRGSGKYAMRQLSPVLRVVGVENVRRQVAWATLTQRCGYTEEDASKVALWGEGRGRWTSTLGFSWSTHRVMGGCADTRCRSKCESATHYEPLRGGENERGDELPGRDYACDQLGIPASLMRRRRERGWREGRRCEC